MTDSMKFGPEWLRNMSADSPISGNPSFNNNNSLSNPTSSFNNYTELPRINMFPQFRYGREEMLSLFYKNCGLPGILPSNKKIFVEKVQFPLALTPITDDDVVPVVGSTVSTQRPAWVQRSPVGFSNSTRCSSRGGGSVDRGRMRGKSGFHATFQRPTVLEDGATSIKSERGWSERNGAGDSLVSGITFGSDWTPINSPRKEFTTNSRNMENWRRNRSEDGSGDAPNIIEGWRGLNSSTFNNRWGRSTSWREDDSIEGSNHEVSASGGEIGLHKSLSTASSSVSDRESCLNNISKSSTNVQASSSRNLNYLPTSISSRINQWPISIVGNGGRGDNVEDNLPEWAIENPSNAGGSFDSSGAFHGSTDDKDTLTTKSVKDNKSANDHANEVIFGKNEELVGTDNEITLSKDRRRKNNVKICSNVETELNAIQNHIFQNSNISYTKNKNDSHWESFKNKKKISNCIEATTDDPSKSAYFEDNSTESKHLPQIIPTTVFSDRMKKAADEMVEKLIMDDDALLHISNNTKDFKINSNVISTMFESDRSFAQSKSISSSSTSVSHQSILNSTTSDQHSHQQQPMQQHNLQQQKLVGSVSNSNVSCMSPPLHVVNPTIASEMWYYRDPQSKVQGPFSAVEMTEWYRAGYFNENLYVRRSCDTRFRTLGELIKLCHGNMPFSHSNLIPVENIGISNPSVEINDFGLIPNNVCEELKNNVTAAAESLSSVVKNVMSTVDMSHIIHMHFQVLQEQYIRRKEMLIVNELLKNECFQRLAPHERDAVVHQKVQLVTLPEYLTSIAGLTNSLAILNPTAGIQLCDAITQSTINTQHQLSDVLKNDSILEQENDFLLNNSVNGTPVSEYPSSSYCNIDTSGINQIHLDEIGLSSEGVNPMIRMQMFLRNAAQSVVNTSTLTKNTLNSNSNEPNCNTKIFTKEQIPVAENKILKMWIPQAANSIILDHQHPEVSRNQWTNGSLLPNATINNTHNSVHSNIVSSSLWDMSNIDSIQSSQINQNQQHLEAVEASGGKYQVLCNNENSNELQSHYQEHSSSVILSDEKYNKMQSHQHQKDIKRLTSSHTESSSIDVKKKNFNQLKQQDPCISLKTKENICSNHKKCEDDKRKELTEEKRRLKEVKKRQQSIDIKQKSQVQDDEKCQQSLEEKDRHKQVHTQRRKVLLGLKISSSLSSSHLTSASLLSNSKTPRKNNILSSVAPWSGQAVVNNNGPCLAEIQKAERKERRADQQRQLEIFDRQNRLNSTSNESCESTLKWNSSPIAVINFAEIQAEEAKRLAAQQLEIQRRKEQEFQSAMALSGGISCNNNVGSNNNNVTNIAEIWGAAKAWGTTSSSGFWEEPFKSPQTEINPHIEKHQNHINSSPPSSSMRNLKKSQSVSVLQKNSNKHSNNILQIVATNTAISKHTIAKLNTKVIGIESNVINSSTAKSKTIKVTSDGSAKKDVLENEFTIWCTKTLNNMSTKVDVPTFVSFLKDLESPFEVKDYIRMYLGENKECVDFSKQFIERRSRYKNLQRAQNAHNDDMCKPAPAITPLSVNDSVENRGKQKKIKKNKMTKLDARILGFSVTAAEGRINVGDRDYVDAL